jgi:hypothetical protein
MRSSREVDLRSVQVSCTSHPVIKLRSILDSLVEEGVKEVKIYFRAEDIPEGVMMFLLSSKGYTVKESRRLDDGSLVFIAERDERHVTV